MKKARSIRRDLLSPEGDPQVAPVCRSRAAQVAGLFMTEARGGP